MFTTIFLNLFFLRQVIFYLLNLYFIDKIICNLIVSDYQGFNMLDVNAMRLRVKRLKGFGIANAVVRKFKIFYSVGLDDGRIKIIE